MKEMKGMKAMMKGPALPKAKAEGAPKGEKGPSELGHRMSQESGRVESASAVPVHAELGAEHSYLGADKSHVKNGFRPVSSNLDMHDSERNSKPAFEDKE